MFCGQPINPFMIGRPTVGYCFRPRHFSALFWCEGSNAVGFIILPPDTESIFLPLVAVSFFLDIQWNLDLGLFLIEPLSSIVVGKDCDLNSILLGLSCRLDYHYHTVVRSRIQIWITYIPYTLPQYTSLHTGYQLMLVHTGTLHCGINLQYVQPTIAKHVIVSTCSTQQYVFLSWHPYLTFSLSPSLFLLTFIGSPVKRLTDKFQLIHSPYEIEGCDGKCLKIRKP